MNPFDPQIEIPEFVWLTPRQIFDKLLPEDVRARIGRAANAAFCGDAETAERIRERADYGGVSDNDKGGPFDY